VVIGAAATHLFANEPPPVIFTLVLLALLVIVGWIRRLAVRSRSGI